MGYYNERNATLNIRMKDELKEKVVTYCYEKSSTWNKYSQADLVEKALENFFEKEEKVTKKTTTA